MTTKNGLPIKLRQGSHGIVDLLVGDQTIAFYAPLTDSWRTVGWVAEDIGLVRKGKGHKGDDPTGSVAFLP